MPESTHGLPPAAMVISHKVDDWETWKRTFDAYEASRVEAGILGHHISRAEDDPNHVTVYFGIIDVERVQAYLASDEHRSATEDAGVASVPELMWVVPAREAVDWDRELPNMIIMHTVADFDDWLAGYDAAAAIRESKGIVGHAANRSLDDPSTVVIYHQADSFDALRALLEDPELRAAMTAGVTSEPTVTFHNSGWAKRYG